VWASHHKELGSDGVIAPHVCDRMVVPQRWVMLDWCNPAESAVDACRDALAWARRTARAADGGVVYVLRALSVSPRAPRMTAQRVARFDP